MGQTADSCGLGHDTARISCVRAEQIRDARNAWHSLPLTERDRYSSDQDVWVAAVLNGEATRDTQERATY